MARRLWPDADPIGKRIKLDEDERWSTVVGVVGDIRQTDLETAEGPALYFPHAQKTQAWLNWMSLVVRTAAGRGQPSQRRPRAGVGGGQEPADFRNRFARSISLGFRSAAPAANLAAGELFRWWRCCWLWWAFTESCSIR